MEALIYTRPYSTDNGVDYCCFCRPSLLSDKEYSEALHHARNVMNIEIDGNIQNECRWHILRISDYVLVGVATTRFGRKDQVNRSIRGYYGVLMPKDSAFVPSWKSFAHLDSTYVTPLFDATQPFSPVTPACVDGVGISPDESEDEFNTPLDFNFAKDKIKIMPVPETGKLPSLLKNALQCAKMHSGFNFVYGLNTKFYASSKPFMNVFCYGVREVYVLQLPIKEPEKSHKATTKTRCYEESNCVPPIPCRELDEVHNERGVGSSSFSQKQHNRIPATERIKAVARDAVNEIEKAAVTAIGSQRRECKMIEEIAVNAIKLIKLIVSNAIKMIAKKNPTDDRIEWGDLESYEQGLASPRYANEAHPCCSDSLSEADIRCFISQDFKTENQYKIGMRVKKERGSSNS